MPVTTPPIILTIFFIRLPCCLFWCASDREQSLILALSNSSCLNFCAAMGKKGGTGAKSLAKASTKSTKSSAKASTKANTKANRRPTEGQLSYKPRGLLTGPPHGLWHCGSMYVRPPGTHTVRYGMGTTGPVGLYLLLAGVRAAFFCVHVHVCPIYRHSI